MASKTSFRNMCLSCSKQLYDEHRYLSSALVCRNTVPSLQFRFLFLSKEGRLFRGWRPNAGAQRSSLLPPLCLCPRQENDRQQRYFPGTRQAYGWIINDTYLTHSALHRIQGALFHTISSALL